MTEKAGPTQGNTHESNSHKSKRTTATKARGGQGKSLLVKRPSISRCGLCYPWLDTHVPTRWQGQNPGHHPPPLEQRRANGVRTSKQAVRRVDRQIKIKRKAKRKRKQEMEGRRAGTKKKANRASQLQIEKNVSSEASHRRVNRRANVVVDLA